VGFFVAPDTGKIKLKEETDQIRTISMGNKKP
jgi:hypothetical protein